MKRFLLLLVCLIMVQFSGMSQMFTPMTAKESIPEVLTKGQTQFSSDTKLYGIFFYEMTGFAEFDLTTGKATGWLYELYSPARDSSIICMVLNIAGMGTLDTASEGSQGAPTDLIELSDPFMDSPAALTVLKNGDASIFLQAHADASVFMASVMNSTQGKEWLFMLGSVTDTLVCWFDAVSGTAPTCQVITKLEGIPEATGYRLDQNFPNPVSLHANTGTTIRYAVAERQSVRLAVYDMLGREIAVLQNGFVNTGEYSMTLPASTFTSSGMYMYRLETARGSVTKKFVVTE